MPDRPTPDRPIGRDTPKGQTNNALIISLVLAGVVAVLILGGATFFNSDEKSARRKRDYRNTRSYRELINVGGRGWQLIPELLHWLPQSACGSR